MSRRRLGLLALLEAVVGHSSPLAAAAAASIYDWPDVLGTTWLFDSGSTHGYILEALPQDSGGYALRGPAPDWALGDASVPLLSFDIAWAPGRPSRHSSAEAAEPQRIALSPTSYPGSVALNGVGRDGIELSAQLVFVSSNASLVRLKLRSHSGTAMSARFLVAGSVANSSVQEDGSVAFGLPRSSLDVPCFATEPFWGGGVRFANFSETNGAISPLAWSVSVNISGGSFLAESGLISLGPSGEVETFLAITSVTKDGSWAEIVGTAAMANRRFLGAVARWDGYLSELLSGNTHAGSEDASLRWVVVKALETLMYNWRAVPGLPDGMLPSYTGYQGGMWSWDSYKQAVATARFFPELARQQLRLFASAQDPLTGHVPDKVDRCGVGGGASGKPPLLAWSVFEVYKRTADAGFLLEMFPVIEAFHRFWYRHRDVRGDGLCSWTEGMESGMDDGVRFMPQYASTVTNASSQVSTLDFWSVDLNSYLYMEKRVLAEMAGILGNSSGAEYWSAEADGLLPRLQGVFFAQGPEPSRGFFQDAYFNGSVVPVRGCEGFAALFAGVATLPQALAAARTISDPEVFLSNFSLPTVSKLDSNFNARGYWKGSTWLDQSWFAYAGLKRYGELLRISRFDDEGRDGAGEAVDIVALAATIRRRLFAHGKGFQENDTTPLNEHYDPGTGEPLGATHFGWSAAHVLLWAEEMAAARADVAFV